MNLDIDFNKIVEKVNSKNLVLRLVISTIGAFLLAINYNLFLEPNNLVIGGLTGLSIVCKEVFSWNPTIFIYVVTSLLIFISLFLLEKKDIVIGIYVGLIYPFFITLTGPLCDILAKYVQFSDKILIALASAILYGFACGIVYKCGFNTGGLDFLIKIVCKYGKISEGKSTFVTCILIVLAGAVVFDVNNVAYSAIILYLSSMIIDKIIIGISSAKLFYIYTKEIDKVKEFIMNELNTGVTILDAEGGYNKKKKKLIMCAVDSKDYYLLKEAILMIDEHAFIIIDDCYEVSGGMKRERINLLEG